MHDSEDDKTRMLKNKILVLKETTRKNIVIMQSVLLFDIEMCGQI